MFGGEMTTLSFVFGGMLGVAVVARRFLGQLGRRSPLNGFLKHVGTLPLTPQCSVALVRAGKETLVLGVTSQSITLLRKIPEAAGEKIIDLEANPAENRK